MPTNAFAEANNEDTVNRLATAKTLKQCLNLLINHDNDDDDYDDNIIEIIDQW